jgi:uncharacterized protein YxeA
MSKGRAIGGVIALIVLIVVIAVGVGNIMSKKADVDKACVDLKRAILDMKEEMQKHPYLTTQSDQAQVQNSIKSYNSNCGGGL